MKSLLFFITMMVSVTQWSCTKVSSIQRPTPLKQEALSDFTWVAYAPTNFNPHRGIQPSSESLIEDLKALSEAGFNGLVTYGCDGVLGKELPQIAESLGFKGLILGLWNLNNKEELENAQIAARSDLVKGFCIGNEGLNVRYNLEQLKTAIDTLRILTGKPVTTTEQIEDYTNEELVKLGDWIFPNVHPYWHGKHEIGSAVKWTIDMYDDLKKRSGKSVLLKEVGFPSAGDDVHSMSEKLQKEYYVSLNSQQCQFVWFEAFDMIWKNHVAVEPHWGLFNADRTPKQIAIYLLSKRE